MKKPLEYYSGGFFVYGCYEYAALPLAKRRIAQAGERVPKADRKAGRIAAKLESTRWMRVSADMRPNSYSL